MKTTSADYVIYGCIFTGEGTIEQAMAVKGKKILYVGSCEGVSSFIGGETRILREENGLILPGMTEGHAHVTSMYEILNYAPLYKGESVEEYIQIYKEFFKEHPQSRVLMGRGYRNGVFEEPGPQACMLDEISREIPIIAIGEDAHSMWVSSKALEMAGIDQDTAEVFGGEIVRYENGTPTGWLKEAADVLMVPLLPKLELNKVKQAVLRYQEEALAQGITHVFEPMLNPQRDYEVCVRAYEELAEEGKLLLQYQVGYMLYPSDDIDQGIERACEYRERARAVGSSRYSLNTIKIFIDGVLEGHTAYLQEPYVDRPDSCGEPLWTQERCNEVVKKAVLNQFQVHIHTIGDGALQMAIQAFRAAKEAGYVISIPHAVTHVQIVGEHQFAELAKLGVCVVVNPYWHTRDSLYYEKLEKPYLGLERAEKEYPVCSFIKAGCLLTQASDFPVTIPAMVMNSLHIMVNRGEHKYGPFEPLNPSEALTVEEALMVLTTNGAKQGGLEQSCGTLTAGKDADFVIFDKNLLTIEPSQLYTAKVKHIFIQGKYIKEQEE